jgi:lambda family phage portal protein
MIKWINKSQLVVKKNEIDDLKNQFTKAVNFAKALTLKRSYDAALQNRLNNDWLSSSGVPEYDVYSALEVVRTRSRERLQNDGYAQQIVRLFKNNVIGPYGFKLKVKATNVDGSLDKIGNAAVESAWLDWTKPENCSVNGKYSIRQIGYTNMAGLVRDGEYLIRRVRGKNYKYGIALQLILPDYLDVKKNEKLDNGNTIRMGVERDRFGKPVAYYIRKTTPETDLYGIYPQGDYERISADDIIHKFPEEYPNQTRGISLLAPALPTMRNQGGFDEAVVLYARVAASTMLFLKNRDSKEPGEFKGTSTNSSGDVVIDWEPLTVQDIQDKDLVDFTPSFPQAEHTPFTKLNLRRIAGATGVSYESLSNDRESVNLSSIRYGVQGEQDGWKTCQEDYIESVLERIYTWWLEEALLKGAITVPSGKSLPVSAFAKFNIPYFIGRAWGYMDPQTEVISDGLRVLMGATSPRRICAERGDDYNEILQELEEDYRAANEKGITLVFGGGKSTTENKSPQETDPQKTAKMFLDTLIEFKKASVEAQSGNGNGKHEV